jgi:AraC family transcriptional regulator
MNQFNSGKFSGETYQTILFDGFAVSETEYDYKFVDWHYHENPFFTLGILGNCREINKREILECSPDTLVFHNCQEAHCNTKSDGISRQFQLELSPDWCRKFEVRLDKLPNSSKILNPNIKLLFYNIYKESKLFDDTSNLTIDALLLQTFETMRGVESVSASVKPRWTKKIDEILHENFDQSLTLQKLSDELNLHWAHLSRDFPRYFRCNFSEYVRKIRVEKSLSLLRNKSLSLTEIAILCGFADQSHFIRTFKTFHGITPKAFRKIIK